MAFDEDLGDSGDFVRPLRLLVWHPYFIQTGNLAAFHAYKVGMATTIMFGISDLESPNVVAEFCPANQFGISQIG